MGQIYYGSFWEHVYIKEPLQNDDNSCGVFVCAFVESYVRSGFNLENIRNSFNNENIPFLRLRMTAILLNMGDSQEVI